MTDTPAITDDDAPDPTDDDRTITFTHGDRTETFTLAEAIPSMVIMKLAEASENSRNGRSSSFVSAAMALMRRLFADQADVERFEQFAEDTMATGEEIMAWIAEANEAIHTFPSEGQPGSPAGLPETGPGSQEPGGSEPATPAQTASSL